MSKRKNEEQRILRALKKLYADVQKIKEGSAANSLIVEYFSSHIKDIIDIALEAESEKDYLGILTEKYRDEVEEKLDKKFA